MTKLVEVNLPMPPMGGKCWLLEEKGIFVLQRGPGTLRTIACTHAGSGSLVAIDGVPDENGFFEGREVNARESLMPTDPTRGAYNGRPFYRANPVVMGSWMLDGGFEYGLTLLAIGGAESALCIATIVWVEHKVRVPR
jgi:hypothetical protein